MREISFAIQNNRVGLVQNKITDAGPVWRRSSWLRAF